MKLIQKGNRQLRVADDRAEQMLKAGYVEIDQETGKPIVAESEEEKALKAMEQENAALKQENEALKAEVEELTAKVAKAAEKKEKAAKKAATPDDGKKAE